MALTVGHQIAEALADAGVTTMFGVISIHNMPILDAVAEQGRIRFIPARGEAGAMNMADAFSRVSGGLGVALTSTGAAAGNAAGAQAEALTAGSRVLHITTQIDRPYMDRDRAAIHDVPKQPEMLKGEYAREALKQGFALEKQFGVNPYRFGFSGATDSRRRWRSWMRPFRWQRSQPH